MDTISKSESKYKGIIHSIGEAFSMQPAIMYVGQTVHPGIVVDRIVEEDVHIQGDPFTYYVGYDEDGNRLFEFRKGTVNVTYK